jgi:diguanylate cyclase
MSRRALRALQLAFVAAVFGSGAPLVWLCRDSLIAQAYAIASIAVALLGLALSELAFWGRAGARAQEIRRAAAARAAADREWNAAIDRTLAAIRRNIDINDGYRADLAAINEQLTRFPPLAEVGGIVAELVNANNRMRAQVASLTRELEDARRQIAALRGHISEVGKIAMIDALTQLGNRRFFDETLEREIAAARAGGGQLCLAIADIDHFKTVNDRFGHVVGDQLLRVFAEMLAHLVEGRGFAARYGGEEFALLFPKLGIAETKRIIDGLRHALETRGWVVGVKEERLGLVTASFGIACLGHDEIAENLVRRADAKLLEAKSGGRNRVAIDHSDAPRPRTAAGE